jgi:hypothetical protein
MKRKLKRRNKLRWSKVFKEDRWFKSIFDLPSIKISRNGHYVSYPLRWN